MTPSLESFGITTSPPQVAADQPDGADAFFETALALLPPLADVVRREIIPSLEKYSGRWHPTGFMVFPLGTHAYLGTLRLHVWPARLRNREHKGRGWLGEVYDGDIHDHSWSVASFVLAAYRDSFYDVTPTQTRTGPLDRELFRVFSVAYGAKAHNALTTNGSCVIASTTDRRLARQGECHTIEAGQFHAPTIPDTDLGATLVFSSPRVLPTGPHVLIGGGIEPILGHRVSVGREEAMEARIQVLSAT